MAVFRLTTHAFPVESLATSTKWKTADFAFTLAFHGFRRLRPNE
jgi:hypothetical protein